MTVMGLTWITGVLVFDEARIPFAYLFTIFVALQVLKKSVENNAMADVPDRY